MKLVMYAFGTDSKDSVTKVVDKYVLYGRDANIADVKYVAKKMLEERPLKDIYVVDSRMGLKEDYNTAVRNNSIEGWVEFRDMIIREGLRVV